MFAAFTIASISSFVMSPRTISIFLSILTSLAALHLQRKTGVMECSSTPFLPLAHGASRSTSQPPSGCSVYRKRSCNRFARPCQNSTISGFNR